MAEMVSSAVAEEIVTQIVSSVLDKQRQERRPSEEERLERLEMAHIKLEAALETSDKWRISDASLLRWRRKLKRAARDCDDALRRCKRERRPSQALPGGLLPQLPELPPAQRGVALARGAAQAAAPPEQGRVRGAPPRGQFQCGLHPDVRHLQPLDALPRAQPVPVPAHEEGGGPAHHLADDDGPDHLRHRCDGVP